jgi:NifU-like protein involved in Fe-S cluster formation
MDYSSEVRRRFLAPARAGTISPDGGELVEGVQEDRSLKFWVRFQVRTEASTIQQVRFQAYGCPHSLAAADLIASELEGRPLGALLKMDHGRLAGQLALPREKYGVLLRIEDALAVCHDQAVSTERE